MKREYQAARILSILSKASIRRQGVEERSQRKACSSKVLKVLYSISLCEFFPLLKLIFLLHAIAKWSLMPSFLRKHSMIFLITYIYMIYECLCSICNQFRLCNYLKSKRCKKIDHTLFISKLSKSLLKSPSMIISLFSNKTFSIKTSNLFNHSEFSLGFL